MKRSVFILALLVFSLSAVSAQVVQTPVITETAIKLYDETVPRTEIILPQIGGYTLYKADFHVHTIYSDGEVTPRERMREAWYDGLDVIAITDHLEIRSYEKFMLKALAPYNKDGKPYVYANAGAGNKKDKDAPMLADLNAGYEEACMIIEKEELPVLVVRGTEIWRDPRTTGEYNAIFLKDINTICHKDLFECFRRVKEQGGLLFHNHPGWRRETMEKSEDQVRAYAEGWVDGVEVVNGATLYPQMIDRCVDEKLFIVANTDVHRPSSQVWARDCGIFRTMTFVLAKECTEEAIKDALLKRRTIGYSANNLVGEECWLKEFINESVDCKLMDTKEKTEYRRFKLTNMCSVPFVLRRGKSVHVLKPFQSLQIKVTSDKKAGSFRNPKFVVDNMWTVGDKHPEFIIDIDK